MKHVTVTIAIASLVLFSCNDNKTTTSEKMTGTDSATTEKKDTSTASAQPMDSAAMMKAWGAYMTPGEQHKGLAKDNGTWNEEITMWMDPAAPPQKSTSTAVNTMIMGGRYQQSKVTGSYNDQPFEGSSTTGYDNAKKVYETTWIDNMGTGIMHMEGTWDDAAKLINFKGKAVDPMTGKEMDVRQTFKIIDDNTREMEMFDTKNGKENKTLHMKITRKK